MKFKKMRDYKLKFKQKIKCLTVLLVLVLILFSTFCFLFFKITFAQILYKPQIPIPETKFAGPIKVSGTTLAEFIQALFIWGTRVIGILAVIMIAVAGVKWMMAMGNPTKISQAKDKISSALIGLILVVGAHFLLNFINPALVRLRSLDILKIEKVNLGDWPTVEAALLGLLQPDFWYYPDWQPYPEANECGNVARDKNYETSFYGGNCSDYVVSPQIRRPCYLSFSMTEEKLKQWIKETGGDEEKLVYYVDKKKSQCIATNLLFEWGTVVLPTPNNKFQQTKFPILATVDCGRISQGEITNLPGVNTYAGAKCPSPNQNCVYITLTGVASGRNIYLWQAYCLPVITKPELFAKNCGPGSKRVYCDKCNNNCEQCTDHVEVENGESICCQDKNNKYFCR